MANFQIFIVADLQGKGLQQRIRKLCGEFNLNDLDTFVRYYPGAYINRTVNRCLRDLEDVKYDFIYLTTGINELSSCVADEISDSDILNNLKPKYLEGTHILKRICKKVVLWELTGLSFKLYNLSGKAFSEQLMVLHEVVMELNKYMTAVNNQTQVVSPFIADHTHKTHHQRLGD